MCSPHPPLLAWPTNPARGLARASPAGFSRLGAALRSVVAGRPHRPPSGPESSTAPDADSLPVARPASAPRQPGRARKGGLARLFRRRPMAAVPEQYREPPDLQFTAEAFPALSPEARAFFNTPLEDCDPAMLGVVLGALAELITGSMTPREGMQDAQDVFLALSSRMATVTGGAGQAPPAAVPEAAAAPADLAATAAIDAQAAPAESPGPALQLPGPAPQLPVRAPQLPVPAPQLPGPHRSSPAQRRRSPSQRCSSPTPRRHWTRPRRHPRGLKLHRAKRPRLAPRPISPLRSPAEPQPSDPPVSGTSMQSARAPDSPRVPPRHARRRLFRDRPAFATRNRTLPRRNIPFRCRSEGRPQPRPPRLFCYAACAGPPALLRRA